MPLITVRLIETVLTAEQKQQTARHLTKAMVTIEGERHARRHVLCPR
jgi:phenylpyruvate tautomerase PptA (4-oxalocrotonate tautomerase family)